MGLLYEIIESTAILIVSALSVEKRQHGSEAKSRNSMKPDLS